MFPQLLNASLTAITIGSLAANFGNLPNMNNLSNAGRQAQSLLAAVDNANQVLPSGGNSRSLAEPQFVAAVAPEAPAPELSQPLPPPAPLPEQPRVIADAQPVQAPVPPAPPAPLPEGPLPPNAQGLQLPQQLQQPNDLPAPEFIAPQQQPRFAPPRELAPRRPVVIFEEALRPTYHYSPAPYYGGHTPYVNTPVYGGCH